MNAIVQGDSSNVNGNFVKDTGRDIIHAAVLSVVLSVCMATGCVASSWYEKIPQYTDTLRGSRLVDELLCGHPLRLYEFCRFRHDCFLKLNQWLLDNTEFRGSRYVSSKEKLVIFLYICGHGASFRNACEIFQHSKDTISR